MNGGRNCDGAFNENRPCNNELCPGKTIFYFGLFVAVAFRTVE